MSAELKTLLEEVSKGVPLEQALMKIKDPNKRRLYMYALASQGKYKIIPLGKTCDCSKCPLRKYCIFRKE